MFVYLLTKNASNLRELRSLVEQVDEIRTNVVSCCSRSSLLSSCIRGLGCILVTGADYSTEEVKHLIHVLRESGFPHAVLVAEKIPTPEKALEWSRLPICDYFQLSTSTDSMRSILVNAQQWMCTEGFRTVARQHLRRQWKTLDEGLKSVLRLLYEGYSNREIAEKLALSSRTIENRRAKLLDSFGVRSFAELIRVATEFMEEDPIPTALYEEQKLLCPPLF